MDIYSKETIDNHQELTKGISLGIDIFSSVLLKISKKGIADCSYKNGILSIFLSAIFESLQTSFHLIQLAHYEAVMRELRFSFESIFVFKKLDSLNEKSFILNDEILQDVIQFSNNEFKQKYESLTIDEKELLEFNIWMFSNNDNNRKIKHIYSNIFSVNKLIELFSESEYTDRDKGAFHRLSQFTHPSFHGMISRLQIKDGKTKLKAVYVNNFAEDNLKDLYRLFIMFSNLIQNSFGPIDISEDEMKKIEIFNSIYDKKC